MATITGKKTGGLTVGTATDDAISGLGGNDILRGRAGDDTLSGGAGSDTFVFESSRERNGFDTITDYGWSAARNGQKDILDLSAVLNRVGGGDSNRASIHSYVWLVEGDKGAWLYIDTDGLGTKAVAQSWALLEGLHAGDPVRVHLASGPDYTLTVRPGPTLSYGTTTFAEASANDGSITATCTITLTGETFAGTNGQPLAGLEFGHLPDGLTAVVTRTSDTTAVLSFTGQATDHASANDVSNLSVTFGNAAFASVNAGQVIGSTKGGLAIDFTDNPEITWSASSFAEADANDGSISDTLTITLAHGIFTGTNGSALPGATFSNVPDGLTAVVTRTSDTTAELSFTGRAKDHVDADDIADLTVSLGDAAFTSGNATSVVGSTKSDLAIDFKAQDNSVVLFDLVDGWSSNHSGRAFQADTSYTIYIRVDSDSAALITTPGANAPEGADFAAWTGADNLGSDDKFVLVGNDSGSEVIGYRLGEVNSAFVGNYYGNSAVFWGTFLTYGAALVSTGCFSRDFNGDSKTLTLWAGSWSPLGPIGNLSEHYQRVLPVGVLTSQAALLP